MSRSFVYDTAIGNMIGRDPSEISPMKVAKFMWKNTGGAFIEGLTGSDEKSESEPKPEEKAESAETAPVKPAPIEPPARSFLLPKLLAKTYQIDVLGGETGNKYSYPTEPLSIEKNEIRLLELLPGSQQEFVKCKLHPVSLDESLNQEYEAISYCWGDLDATVPIQMDNDMFLIRPNLHAALFWLRKEDTSRMIWVDAICINQTDLTERGTQVTIMRDIYKRASRTVVWLGDADEDSDEAYSVCRSLVEYAKDPIKPQGKLPPEIHRFVNDSSVEHLISRAWWTRVWVVQEVVLAKSVQLACGSQIMDWDDTLCKAIDTGKSVGIFQTMMFNILELDGFDYYTSMKTLKDSSLVLNTGDRLFGLLVHLRDQHATLAHDKVYAVIGLLDCNLEEFGIVPDYSESLSNVFRKTAVSIMKSSENLDILGMCLANEFSTIELPTWCPDWGHSSRLAIPLLFRGDGEKRETSASDNTKATPIFLNDQKYLVLSGHGVDTISSLAEIVQFQDDSAWDNLGADTGDSEGVRAALKSITDDFGIMYRNLTGLIPHLATFVKWEEFAEIKPTTSLLRRTPQAEKEAAKEAETIYWQTLCAGCPPQKFHETEAMYREWHASLNPIRNLRRWKTDKYAASSVFRPIGFLSYLRSTWEKYPEFGSLIAPTKGRRLARTEWGRLCLVPEHTKEGDAVLLAHGGRTPLIARFDGTKFEGRLVWELVGEAYVHGIMDGEDFNEKACRDMIFR